MLLINNSLNIQQSSTIRGWYKSNANDKNFSIITTFYGWQDKTVNLLHKSVTVHKIHSSMHY